MRPSPEAKTPFRKTIEQIQFYEVKRSFLETSSTGREEEVNLRDVKEI